jgi:hypothetical protein
MSQHEEPPPPVKNRRFGPRRKPRGPAWVTCTTSLGKANLARTLLDVSRSGARLLLRSQLAPGAHVAVGLPWPGRARQDTLAATVAWCLPIATGGFCVGVQFHRLLSDALLEQVVTNPESGLPIPFGLRTPMGNLPAQMP